MSDLTWRVPGTKMRNFLALTNFVSFWCGPPVTSSSVALSPEPPPPAQHLHGGGRLRFQGTWVLATLAGWANKETGDSAIPYSQGWGADLGGVVGHLCTTFTGQTKLGGWLWRRQHRHIRASSPSPSPGGLWAIAEQPWLHRGPQSQVSGLFLREARFWGSGDRARAAFLSAAPRSL